jgi:predicted GNAT superfamily acetyltransferase
MEFLGEPVGDFGMSAGIVTITKEVVTGDTSLANKILTLNNTHAQALSWLDRDRLCHLVAEAFFAGRVGGVDGLLIAFDQNADYDSPNFLWFQSRFSHFVYVDRVAVAPEARGRGLARSLYLKLFSKAAQSGHDKVFCEINLTPPNPESDAFHAALGFKEIGSGSVHGGQKTVRYMAHQLNS